LFKYQDGRQKDQRILKYYKVYKNFINGIYDINLIYLGK